VLRHSHSSYVPLHVIWGLVITQEVFRAFRHFGYAPSATPPRTKLEALVLAGIRAARGGLLYAPFSLGRWVFLRNHRWPHKLHSSYGDRTDRARGPRAELTLTSATWRPGLLHHPSRQAGRPLRYARLGLYPPVSFSTRSHLERIVMDAPTSRVSSAVLTFTFVSIAVSAGCPRSSRGRWFACRIGKADGPRFYRRHLVIKESR